MYRRGSGRDNLTRTSWTQLKCWTSSLCFVALSTKQWDGGDIGVVKETVEIDSRKWFKYFSLNIYSAFFSCPPPSPFFTLTTKCFIYVLTMFSYQPCLGWDQVLSCKRSRRPDQEVSLIFYSAICWWCRWPATTRTTLGLFLIGKGGVEAGVGAQAQRRKEAEVENGKRARRGVGAGKENRAATKSTTAVAPAVGNVLAATKQRRAQCKCFSNPHTRHSKWIHSYSSVTFRKNIYFPLCFSVGNVPKAEAPSKKKRVLSGVYRGRRLVY